MCEKDVGHTRKVSFRGVKDEQKIGEPRVLAGQIAQSRARALSGTPHTHVRFSNEPRSEITGIFQTHMLLRRILR